MTYRIINSSPRESSFTNFDSLDKAVAELNRIAIANNCEWHDSDHQSCDNGKAAWWIQHITRCEDCETSHDLYINDKGYVLCKECLADDQGDVDDPSLDFDDDDNVCHYCGNASAKAICDECAQDLYGITDDPLEFGENIFDIADDDEPCEYCAEHGTMVCPDCITQDEQDSIR